MTKKIIITLLCVAVAATLGVGIAVTGASAHDTTIEQWGIEYFNQLDYGIYWYADKDNEVPTKDYVVDKEKPTIVYVHGWKPDESHLREGMSLKDLTAKALRDKKQAKYPYEEEFYRYYLDEGYNVGVFYWNLLADNSANDFTVDTRIWMSLDGENMRYRTYSAAGAKPDYSKADDPTNPKKSVALLYADALIEALGKDYDGFLHLAGHSMGGQLTLAVSEALCVMKDKGKLSAAFLPDRVTLLDPYIDGFSDYAGTVDHLGKYYDAVKISQLVANASETVRAHGIPIEAYGANLGMVFRNYMMMSIMPGEAGRKVAEEAKPITETLGKNIAWVYMGENAMDYYGGFNPTHVMAVDYYFTTNNFSVRKSVEGVDVPCAQMSVDELQKLIGLTFKQTVRNPKAESPLYYTSGTFSLVDFDTMQEPTGDYQRISGRVEIADRKGATVKAIAVDADGVEAATANVDEGGYYYLKGLKEGTYTVKFVANNKEIGSVADVETTGVVLPEYAETIEAEVPQALDMVLLVVILGLCLLMVIVVVAAFICAVRRNNRKKREYSIR